PGQKVLLVVAGKTTVRLVIPTSERRRLRLLYDPSSWSPSGLYRLSAGDDASVFQACPDETQFNGGFIVAGPQCARVLVYVGRRGSNPRPSAWEADALPTELRPREALILAPAAPYSMRGPGMRRPSGVRGRAGDGNACCRARRQAPGTPVPAAPRDAAVGDRRRESSKWGFRLGRAGRRAPRR